VAVLVVAMEASTLQAQQSMSVEDLAKLRANPLSGQRSITLQDQVNFGFPTAGQPQNLLTVQAVWPFALSSNWDLIAYPSVNIVSQPGLEPGESSVTGLSDTLVTTAITPKETGALIWGIGPAVQLPTATKTELGSDLWAAGPALGLFLVPDPWTIGALVENL
jgi:hypothetical protein